MTGGGDLYRRLIRFIPVTFAMELYLSQRFLKFRFIMFISNMDQTEFLPKPCETAAKTAGSRHRWLAAHPRSLEVGNFTPNIDEGLKSSLGWLGPGP